MSQRDRGARRRAMEGQCRDGLRGAASLHQGQRGRAAEEGQRGTAQRGKERVMSSCAVGAGRARRLVFRLAVLAGDGIQDAPLGRLRMKAAAPAIARV